MLRRRLRWFAARSGPRIPVLVQEMVSGVELLITVRLDTDWGPVLTVGAGGALVELLDDIAHVSLPCSEAEIAEAVARLDVDRLLRGFRGAPPADREAAVKAASLLSRITLSQGDAIEEIELNPLVVGTAGEGVYVVDVLVTQPESVGPRSATAGRPSRDGQPSTNRCGSVVVGSKPPT